jgi:hypothetical protein
MIKNVLQLESIMMLLTFLGIVLRKRGTITDQGRDCLTDLLMNVILPCNIFLSFQTETDLTTLRSFLVTILISVLVMLLVAILGRLLYRRRKEQQEKVFRYGLVNSNSLFIGLPVIQSLLGDAGVLQLTMYMIFVRIFCWSYGLSLYTGVKSDWKSSVKRLAANPCMLAAELGLLLMLTGWRLPAFLEQALQYISNCQMAMSMILVGVVLAEMDLKCILRGDVWSFTALRLMVIPGIIFLGCKLFQVPYIITATCTLLSGMPAASLTAVLATRYHKDAKLAALLVAVSTILSTVTVPLWFLLLQ